jgi:hypothetical protein
MNGNEVYCIFDNYFHPTFDNNQNPTKWRWEGSRYWGGQYKSLWYSMDIKPTLELFKKFVAGEAALDQT